MKWIFRLLTLGSMAAIVTLPLYMDRLGGITGFSTGSSGDQPPVLSVGQPLESEVTRQVYKWRDKNGVWQYSDVPPGEGTQTDIIKVSNQTNIIQSVPVRPEPQQQDPRNNISEKSKKVLDDAKNKDLLSLDRARNIIEETKAVRELMESRNHHLENVSEGGAQR
jgi:hypothetical protein